MLARPSGHVLRARGRGCERVPIELRREPEAWVTGSFARAGARLGAWPAWGGRREARARCRWVASPSPGSRGAAPGAGRYAPWLGAA